MEERDIQRLLDLLQETINNAKGSTFNSDKCTVSRSDLLDIVDEISGKLPLELKHAKELVEKRKMYISEAEAKYKQVIQQAEQEAKTIVSRAEKKANMIISDSETLQQARQESSEILRRAEGRTRELYRVANSYTEDALNRTEDAIRSALAEVQESHKRFHAASVEKLRELHNEEKKPEPVKEKTVEK